MKSERMKTGTFLILTMILSPVFVITTNLEAQTDHCRFDCLSSFSGCLVDTSCRVLTCPSGESCSGNQCSGSRAPCGRAPEGCGTTCDLARGACMEGCTPTYFPDLFAVFALDLDIAVRRALLEKLMAAEETLDEIVGSIPSDVGKHLESYRREVRELAQKQLIDKATAQTLEALVDQTEDSLRPAVFRRAIASQTNPKAIEVINVPSYPDREQKEPEP